jgi:hypothetical protein
LIISKTAQLMTWLLVYIDLLILQEPGCFNDVHLKSVSDLRKSRFNELQYAHENAKCMTLIDSQSPAPVNSDANLAIATESVAVILFRQVAGHLTLDGNGLNAEFDKSVMAADTVSLQGVIVIQSEWLTRHRAKD